MRALWVTLLVELALGSHIRTTAGTYQVGFIVFAGMESAFIVSWQGPEEGVVKLDVDESSLGNPTGRVGSRESYSHNCGNLSGGIYSFCRYGI